VSLSDAALRHLKHVADLPDLTGTRYELVEPLGRGGMGAVYRVTDRALGRDVALKVLCGATDAASLARLETEARILAQLEHPGIVPVHDVGTLPDGRLFYVMKLVRGQRLDAWADRAGAVSERVRLLERVADAVAFAHARGIVHRDLTPANIMIGAFGEVLVMDWGLALSNQTQPDPTRPNPAQPVIAGTAGFMAPEQARGAADARSDVYALGALLAWYLAPERGGPVRIPRPLKSIAAKARATDPAARYATAEAFAADLSRYLDAQAVLAHRESLAERTLRFARTYRVAILLVLGYLIMRIALLAYRGL
jgi:eukaryotic-like serine/threonine-protein kinase